MADSGDDGAAFWTAEDGDEVVDLPDDEEDAGADEEGFAEDEGEPTEGEGGEDDMEMQPLAEVLFSADIGEPVYAVATHPFAPIVAAGHGGDGVRVWDAQTGVELMRADGCHSDSVTAVAFSADGKLLASASLDKTLRVWRIEERAHARAAEKSDDEGAAAPHAAAAAATTPAASAAAASSAASAEEGDERAAQCAWEVLPGRKPSKSKGKKKSKQQKAASAAKSSYPEPLVLEGPAEDIEWMAWHPKSPALLCGSADCTAWVFNASTGECISVLAGHEGAVTVGVFSTSGKKVITASDDGTLRVWAPATGECKTVIRGDGWFEAGDPVVSLACHPTKPLVIAGGTDGTARLANTATGRVLAVLRHRSAAAATLEKASARAEDALAKAVDAATSRLRAGETSVELSIPGSSGAASDGAEADAVASAAPADAAASGAGGTSEPAQGDAEAEEGAEDEGADPVEMDVPSVEGVGFCPVEGLQLAATGASDGTMRVWDMSTFSVRAACRQEGSIVRLQWHPTEPAVVTCASDGSVRAFDARDGTTIAVLAAHAEVCLDMQLRVWDRPDGATDGSVPWGEAVIATGGDDGRAALLELGI
ncbi:hypothetical protein FNF29_05117 [Cafeteria roenbergensis]|uniref:Anaphase-promoting complex subunit 4-like WD40 domain-containing protein n=1 Tax=Cafeteria roenbergensis TaxID=33653 RepID=A0A5A8CBY5_CAFRO|nr:hypothetical protein FNF29_05117 [Cafeteria roenbergensis]|eukprot:KAA0150542.1 hypothetical protein FNF29_05117 [Cafeteria roenbergensis]